MTTGGNQAAITADVLGVAVAAPRRLRVERDPSRLRIVTAMRQWVDGRNEARALAHSARSEHVETHWQKMNDNYSDSWRWSSF